MLNIIISFDYEIFFGRNIESLDSILFEPTNKILNVLDEEKVSGTFFVDTLSYEKHFSMGMRDYCTKFSAQCTDIIKRGHEAQLHIHAHWMSAVYDETINDWHCDYTKYKIQAYSKDKIEWAIDNGLSFLKECASNTKYPFECLAFRAGGLILQPEKDLLEILINKGLKFDSSIARYTMSKYDYADYDYTNVPKELNWYLSPQNGLEINAHNDERTLFEVPVATVKNDLFRLSRVKGPIRITNMYPGGIGFIRPSHKKSFLQKVYKKIFDYHWVSLDTRSATLILSDLKSIYNKYDCERNDYTVALIGHPKMFNDWNVENLLELIGMIKKENTKYNISSFRALQKSAKV